MRYINTLGNIVICYQNEKRLLNITTLCILGKCEMKARYVLVLVLSLLSLSLSLVALSSSLSRDRPSSGVKEVELFGLVDNDVTIGSQNYVFSLPYFKPYYDSYTLKVEYASGYVTRRIYLDKATEICGLLVILKECRSDSVIVWIEA